MYLIRTAAESDVAPMLEIYAHYVQKTAFSFEYDVPTIEEFTRRFHAITAQFAWLVCEHEGRVAGYAYASRAFERAAYMWDADLSVYIAPEHHGKGLGRALYAVEEEFLQKQGYYNVYALITGANAGSVRFHEAVGYRLFATFPKTGFKFGRWYDVYWYAKRLPQTEIPAGPPLPFNQICDAAGFCRILPS